MKHYINFLILLVCISCNNETIEQSLENGLINYKTIRNINEPLLEGYFIKKVAFFKMDSTHYKFAFLLDNDVSNDSVSKYSFGLVVFPEEEYITNNENYIVWGMQPNIINKNGYKYIIKEVDTKIKQMDSLHVFLYDRDQYRGVKSDMIRLKNIRLK